jgi:hypothetical protein
MKSDVIVKFKFAHYEAMKAIANLEFVITRKFIVYQYFQRKADN